MLDPGLEDSTRDKLADDVRKRIDSDGTLRHEDNWGTRKMAYEIRQRTEADYRWYRFEAPRELLGQLDHNLKIADGVLRFRIFRVDPNSPVIAPPSSGPPAPKQEAPEEPSPEPPQEPPPEPSPDAPEEPPQDPPEEPPQDAPEEAAEETPEETPAA